MTKQRITLISLAGLLVFSLLFGGQMLYKRNWVNANILEQSRQIPGVVSAKVVEVNGQQELDVVIGRITDLRQASAALSQLAGARPIRFLDSRNAKLEQLFNQMQFALQEGISRGNFTEMADRVSEQAEKAGVKLHLAMDSEAIYLVLNEGDAQLVAVLERHGQSRFLPSEKNS